jgi:NIMA (never in mitosis gene a)-related kinase
MPVPVDLAFVFDATGSMEATIQAVYAKIVAISVMLREHYPTDYSFHFSAVGYRDKLDDGSPTVCCPFSSDPMVMENWLTTVEATGGGDVCEDWVDAMEQLFSLNWRPNSLRCIFWIADTPAHGAGLWVQCENQMDFDAHPEQILFLIPYAKKLAQMKMVVIGLDLSLARLSFNVLQQIYVHSDGPSFSIEEFRPETGNETNSIAELLESKAMTLVDQTISQTCAVQVGTNEAAVASAPTPPVTPGPSISIPLAVVKLFADYHDITYLDQGVQGAVYSAVADSNGENVAIKHMKLDSEDARKYFVRELAAIRAFGHPACLKYVGSKDTGAEGILVTQFEPNGTLERMLKVEFNGSAGPQWPTSKTIIVFGIAFGMEHIHKNRFVHRDLKPANIFLNPDFEPVIGDFGVTTDFNGGSSDGSSGPSMCIGTPLHMAPEVWVDESEGYNQAVDVYAYAVLLYCLFTSEPQTKLTDGKGKVKNVSDLMKRIGTGARFGQVPEINSTYWDLITSGWQKEPINRPTFSEIVDAMIANVPLFLFPGAKEAEVRQYIAKMIPLR